MRSLIPRRGLAALASALVTLLALGLPGQATAQAAAPAATTDAAKVASPAADAGTRPGAPAGYVAPADPKADETNAQRAKSQPGNNAPMWRAVQQSGTAPGVSNLPGAETGVLIQRFTQYPGSLYTSAGEAWRQVRNNRILPYGGALLLIAALGIGLFYWKRGPIGGHEAPTGRKIERFTPFERAVHWTNAISFVVLAISGIVIAFGKFFLLPVIGGTLFGWLTYALKTIHNFVGPVFAVSLVVMLLSYAKDNIPRKADLQWLARLGGALGDAPSHRFNGGEKLMFWVGVCLLGLAVVASGLVLDKLVPGWGETRGQMQVAHLVHAAAAIVMMAMLAGHIYMGSIGMQGALDAMRTGYVDESWAKAHHPLWHEDIRNGKIPAQRSAPKPGVAAAGIATPASQG